MSSSLGNSWENARDITALVFFVGIGAIFAVRHYIKKLDGDDQ